MNAADVMTPDVICAAPDTPLPELVRLMLDNQVSALPVIADGQIVGIVSEGDLMRRAETGTEPRPSRWLELVTSTDRLAADYTHAHGRKASEIMTHDVVTVADTMPIAEVAHLLETRRIKRVPVTRDGRLVGIVSRRNLLQALATRLSTPPVTADDRTIRDAFYTELRRQTWAITPGAINAVVAEGVVHLWGVAPDEALRQAIVVVAENVPGVRAVEDHMEHRRVIDPLDRPNWPSPGRP
ncbi:MAG TPA: CBS domain-containing protein [Acetobacteraceae bacterium]|nr:CBS domain-containing protein [Acetobacteraceae bacterium]